MSDSEKAVADCLNEIQEELTARLTAAPSDSAALTAAIQTLIRAEVEAAIDRVLQPLTDLFAQYNADWDRRFGPLPSRPDTSAQDRRRDRAPDAEESAS